MISQSLPQANSCESPKDLAREAHQTFWLRGWVTIENVFSPLEADAIADLALQLSNAELASETLSSAAADFDAHGHAIPRKLLNPFLKHADFRTFVLSRRLRALVDCLLEKPAALADDQIFMKPPRFGSAKPYHQDNAYFLCEPADDVLTAWIALDDVDETNGCLRYIDGSHREGILDHIPIAGEPHNMAPAASQIDLTRERLACVGKGGVVFHHGSTLHTSHRNESDRWRRGYATHWVSRDATCQSDFLNNAYFHRHRQLYERALATLEVPSATDRESLMPF